MPNIPSLHIKMPLFVEVGLKNFIPSTKRRVSAKLCFFRDFLCRFLVRGFPPKIPIWTTNIIHLFKKYVNEVSSFRRKNTPQNYALWPTGEKACRRRLKSFSNLHKLTAGGKFGPRAVFPRPNISIKVVLPDSCRLIRGLVSVLKNIPNESVQKQVEQ